MVLLSMEALREWIESFFLFFDANLFTVGGVTFSFFDVFLGAVKLSVIGYGIGHLIFKIKDKR